MQLSFNNTEYKVLPEFFYICFPAISGCKVDGKFYKVGESFILDNCSARCHCDGNALYSCVDLCPVVVPPHCCSCQVLKWKDQPVGDGKCSCHYGYCADKTYVCNQGRGGLLYIVGGHFQKSSP